MANGNGITEKLGDGIYVDSGENAQVTGNTANENGWDGIAVWSVENATVTGNTANGNLNDGIQLSSSTGAKVTDNTANGNLDDGIHVYSSTGAKVKGNTVSGNRIGVGITGVLSTDVEVFENNIFGNIDIVTNIALGLDNTSGNPVVATHNWWGPGGTGDNAGKPGEGGNNGVSGNVTFDPWSKVKF